MRDFNQIKPKDVITFTYTNWAGKTGSRKTIVKGFFWGTSPFHEGEQLFLKGLDLDKMAYRDYAVVDIENLIVVESIEEWDFEDCE